MNPTFKEIPPHILLSDLIDCYWFSNPIASILPLQKHLVTPDNRVDFLFIEKSGRVELGFSGPMSLPFHASNQSVFGIRFKLQHIHALIAKPLVLFLDQFVNIEDVYLEHKELKKIFDQHSLIQQRLEAFDKYFIGLLPKIRQESDTRIAYCLKKLEQGFCWKDISHEIGHSQQYLRRLFARNVGLAPKKIEKIWRFNRTKTLISNMSVLDFTELAHNAGYYDQAHFNHDFKELSGSSPSTFLA